MFLFTGFPILKVRLQTQRATGEAGTMIYRGAIDCLMKTIRHETVAGLYKGVTSPILGIGFCNAILFTANGQFRKLLSITDTNSSLCNFLHCVDFIFFPFFINR